MDDERIQNEMERIQKQMAELDPTTDDYATLARRLAELVDLQRTSNMEDEKTLMAAAEQAKADAQLESIKSHESENEKTRKHSYVMTAVKGLGVVGLMILSHCLSVSTIPDKFDQHWTELWHKDKEKDEDK